MLTPRIFDVLLSAGGLHCVYQPLIDIDSGETLSYEALLRGPAGTPLESPLDLLEEAREINRLAELEAVSLRISLADAARFARGRQITLFVNVEPTTLTNDLDVVLEALASRASNVRVVVELTERALADNPAAVIAGADQLRAAGCAIALDDVGANPASLAFVPILRPEVVKLDLSLLRTAQDPVTVAVTGAVVAYAEESGADVVAEGVETAADLDRANMLGATIGQGWLWGRPDRTMGSFTAHAERFEPRAHGRPSSTTPFDLLGEQHRVRVAPKSRLIAGSAAIESAAQLSRVPPMLLATFQETRHFTAGTARRFEGLAAQLPFVGAMAEGMPARPAGLVRGINLSPDDPLSSEWTVAVLGAHFAAAIIARDLGDTGPQLERRFAYYLTHDRALITAACHALFARVPPVEPS